jgi:alpha,alpha-trehalase
MPQCHALFYRCVVGSLLQVESNIAEFAAELEEGALAAQFAQHAERRLGAINALLWDEGSGQWRDLALEPGDAEAAELVCSNTSVSSSSFKQSSVVAASNWVPLYCGCAPAGGPQAAAAVASLQQSGLIQVAGLAVSLACSGQQWDWPNSWPPITCMLLEGCREYGGEQGAQVCTCVCEWQDLGCMLCALLSNAAHSAPPASHLPSMSSPPCAAAGGSAGAAVPADCACRLAAERAHA